MIFHRTGVANVYAGQTHSQQQGITLFVVMVMILLAMMVSVWAARSTLFSQMVVGNDADYQRTFAAAQAMLQDAEFDIRGVQPSGKLCQKASSDGDICRRTTLVHFDIESKDLEAMLTTVGNNSPLVKCFKGICQKRADPQDFWNVPETLQAMTAPDIGAYYGQFTGADAASTANPILNSKTEVRAWYWIEVMPYLDPNVSLLGAMPPGSNVERFAPSRKTPWVYRITALARGNKPLTEVILQSTLSVQTVE